MSRLAQERLSFARLGCEERRVEIDTMTSLQAALGRLFMSLPSGAAQQMSDL